MKIIFALRDLERGGIQRVTLNLIAKIDRSRYDVTLLCGNVRGIFADAIPGNCTLISGGWLLRALMCDYRKESGVFRLFALAMKSMRKVLKKIFHFDLLDYANDRLARKIAGKDFDVAWACEEGMPACWLVRCSGRRIIQIHNDYHFDFARGDLLFPTDFSKFNKIVCVAEHTMRAFQQVYPQFAEKCEVLYNVLNTDEIIGKAAVPPDDPRFVAEDDFICLSIGRFSPEKQFYLIPDIAAQLVIAGCHFKWYIIGSGGSEETGFLLWKIREKHVEDHVVLLGQKSNPYAYLSRSSIFVLTSRYESYPTVINEAKFLRIPVLSSDFDGVGEIMTPGCGVVAPLKDFASRLEGFIRDPSLLDAYREDPAHFAADEKAIMQKFYALIEAEQM